jgi:hypothetical protein
MELHFILKTGLFSPVLVSWSPEIIILFYDARKLKTHCLARPVLLTIMNA